MLRIIMILSLLLSTGCSHFPTVRSVADELETIPLGASQDKIYLENYKLNIESVTLQRVLPKMNLWIMRSPDIQTIYRQWPKGTLLYLVEDDLYYTLPVRDNEYRTGGIHIYFDKEYKYKGYFAYSDMYYSKDTKDRLEKEKQYYTELGINKERERATKRFEKFEQDTHNMEKYYPSLPLRAPKEP